MKKNFTMFFFFFVGFLGLSAKIVPLNEILQPHWLDVDNNHIYVCEKSSVFIYSIKDFSLIKKIGREGEGPNEFKGAVYTNSQSERLIVNGLGKISFYSKNGDYISEQKVPNFLWRHITPLDNYFVVLEYNVMGKSKIIVCDSKLKKINTIATANRAHQRGKVYESSFLFKVYNKKIFTVLDEKFVIDIFSTEGKKLQSIVKEYDKIKFTEKMQEDFLESYRRNPVTKEFYTAFKVIAKFPKYIPSVKNIFISNDKIYAQTFKTTDKESEFMIFTEDGKFLKSIFLPVKDAGFMDPAMFTIYNDKLFHLYEDEESEEWHLHVFDIES